MVKMKKEKRVLFLDLWLNQSQQKTSSGKLDYISHTRDSEHTNAYEISLMNVFSALAISTKGLEKMIGSGL